jgi:hypothetical protein
VDHETDRGKYKVFRAGRYFCFSKFSELVSHARRHVVLLSTPCIHVIEVAAFEFALPAFWSSKNGCSCGCWPVASFTSLRGNHAPTPAIHDRVSRIAQKSRPDTATLTLIGTHVVSPREHR